MESMTSIKRISYAYNSVLEEGGQDAYFLDAMDFEDGETVVDVHKTYRTKGEFMDGVLALLPLFECAEDGSDSSGGTSALI